MQNEGLLENNSVCIAGIVSEECRFSHEVYGEGFYVFYLKVARLSENKDILPVTVSERLLDKSLLVEGVKVKIEGQLRSYNNYSDKKNRLILTVFARDIQIVESLEGINPNEIFLNGFICKQPVYRTTPFGREISDVLVAVNRAYNKSDYIPCIAWGRNARFVGNLKVGDNIKIWGRIQSRVYQKKIGEQTEEKTAYEVSVSKIEAQVSATEQPYENENNVNHENHENKEE